MHGRGADSLAPNVWPWRPASSASPHARRWPHMTRERGSRRNAERRFGRVLRSLAGAGVCEKRSTAGRVRTRGRPPADPLNARECAESSASRRNFARFAGSGRTSPKSCRESESRNPFCESRNTFCCSGRRRVMDRSDQGFFALRRLALRRLAPPRSAPSRAPVTRSSSGAGVCAWTAEGSTRVGVHGPWRRAARRRTVEA